LFFRVLSFQTPTLNRIDLDDQEGNGPFQISAKDRVSPFRDEGLLQPLGHVVAHENLPQKRFVGRLRRERRCRFIPD
jgi:hypothetical protein